MFVKDSKCSFVQDKVEYLGHYISGDGVQTDPKKVETVKQWPVPQIIKDLRSFLGLTGYYRRFIKDYAAICRPLHDLLKKNSFCWNASTQTSFEQLKEALCSSPVLALLDFQNNLL